MALADSQNDELVAVIGLEVHCQLALATKLFSSCASDAIDPVTLGLPGTLPVLNDRAVDFGATLGVALGAQVHSLSLFERKNYFYPDLPKGYQITQFARPLCTGGGITLTNGTRVRLDRVQIEEDAGKTIHGAGHALVDFRRAGVGLLEIVTHPDMSDPAEAAEFLRRLHRIIVFYGISDGDLELGHFRADANVSVKRRRATVLGTRTEIKNINSFRNVERALMLEIQRQKTSVLNGEAIIMETRGFDADRDRTFSMRSKEQAHDYRYFTDPDLPPVVVSAGRLASVTSCVVDEPGVLAQHLCQEFGFSLDDAEAICARFETWQLFRRLKETLQVASPKSAGSFLVAEVLKWPARRLQHLSDNKPLDWLARALDAVASNRVAAATLREHAGALFDDQSQTEHGPWLDFEQWAEAQGLVSISDSADLAALATELVQEFPTQAEGLRQGKDKLMAFFVGHAMKRTRGTVSAPLFQAKIREILGISGILK
jgi:aspartyl-tRNA(Asn)/glutamyl-tRNA(Gln) amidotransferase subunit B